jgi:Mrp family chromosome partitioning ATPase
LNREGAVREFSSQGLVRVDANAQLAPAEDSRAGRGNSASGLVQLTASLFFREGAPRVIALVSCKPREGVSALCRSFRDFLSGVGARVVLMQAADCLAWPRGRGSFPAGTFRSGPSTSENFLAAKEDSDVLLVDCSSLETSPAVFMLAAHVDGVVLVVEDGRHSARDMQKAVKLIKDVNGVMLGVVLTNRQRLLPRWLSALFSRRNR